MPSANGPSRLISRRGERSPHPPGDPSAQQRIFIEQAPDHQRGEPRPKGVLFGLDESTPKDLDRKVYRVSV
ncbi:protein of unknown function [Burkholderia multivorans]